MTDLPYYSAGVIFDGKDTWMQTWRGNKISILHPTVDMINIEDVASGIAKICRFNGNIIDLFVVAQHCCHGVDFILRENSTNLDLAREFLLHDAVEHRLGDLIRPVKLHFPDYEKLDHRHWLTFAEKYRMPLEMSHTCKYVDNLMCAWEKRDLMPEVDRWPGLPDPDEWNLPPIEVWDWKKAEREWLKRFEELFND